jgi:NADH dehydrogenase [ubiquinone] 1 alpha subcomplex assembly factor 7
MTPLGAEIARQIERDGPMPVEEFMRRCLSHPEHGYYRTRPPIGAGGDFITAPEISQIFGELIGLWAAEMWIAMERPSPVRLIELGPGRGTLMKDALRAVAKVAPDFRAAIDLHLVEINPLLRATQQDALADAAPHWHDNLTTLPDGPAIIIANEFFDALPIRQVVRDGNAWRERVVTREGDAFAFASGAAADAPHGRATAPDGAIVETSPEGEALAGAIAARIATQGGAALIIDYGPMTRGTGDTLQALRAQQKVSPLEEPGLADLTAHVDFAGLAAAASASGVAVYGPLPQGRWLHRLGITARTAILLKTASPTQARTLTGAVGRLIDDAQMGTLFKAVAILDSRLPVPPGFDPIC